MPKRTDIQNMKRLLLIASAFCFLPVIVFGETLYVQNGTEFTLYLRASSGEGYRQAPPDGLLPVDVTEDLEGFAYDRGSFQLATVQIAVELFADQEFVRITGADLSDIRTLSPSDVAEAISGPRLDNQYLDWLSVAPLFARGRGRQPLGSFVDTGTGRQSISPCDSLLWERAGTDLEWMKTTRVGDDLYFAASTYSAFARSSSLSLFVYGASDLPVASIDVDAANDTGVILLWTPLAPEPVVIGNSVASDFFVEGQIWLDVVSAELSRDVAVAEVLAGNLLARGTLAGEELDQAGAPTGVTIEIATASNAAGVWEEFVLARVPLSLLLGQ
ncbi:MAG: hypothetical protein KAU31_00690 [Spirochaetaceae bacterium]|nr:hypothetical protein [Spirochaetaceae bacterium]